jgi:three-Cys-motif partner protein
MPPRSTRWPIEPHTQVKHLILQKYLYAWLPIMGQTNDRIVYIDGFAGPGRYSQGEDGSPIIALKALLDHPRFQIADRRGEVEFLFIESDEERATALEEELTALKSIRPFPKWLKYAVKQGEFDTQMTEILDDLKKQEKQLAPTFAFIDPFGYKGLPLQIISRIVQNKRCECLINFMYEAFTRHAGKSESWIQDEWDQLFGTQRWRDILSDTDPKRRFDKAVELYHSQLILQAKLKYVRTFAMRDHNNQPVYVLFFGTNNLKGLSQMKQAMWKADPQRGQVFSDWTDVGQMVLLQPGQELGLRDELQKKFRGHGYVKIEEIAQFVLEETAYSEASHLKQKTLAPMENETPPLIEVQRPLGSQNRRGTYPEGTKLKFL